MKLCYLIWDFTTGGAQIGLLNLLRNGLATQSEVVVVGVAPSLKGITAYIPSGVRVVEIPRRSTFVAFIQFCACAFIYSKSSDVLLTSLFPSAIAGRLIKLLKPRILLVSLEHSPRIKNKYRHWMLSKTSRLVDLSLSDCRSTLEYSKSIYSDSGTILDEIQLVALQPQAKIESVLDELITLTIISVGRMVKGKNFDYLLHESKLLKDKNIEFTLMLVGEGPERKKLEDLAIKLGIDKQVLFLGHREDVDFLLRQADIYVQCSLWEGQCFAVIEAMAAALPVITTNVGGLTDYTVDGANCLHINSSNKGELANAVLKLVETPKLAKKISENALRTVSTRFSDDSQQRNLENILENIQGLLMEKRQKCH
jgi:glycosyltransferase involved in cell wall biosynthesis